MKKLIVVKLQHEATHNWPECPLNDVAFLKLEHRHMFHITCRQTVSHNDRETEIILLKRSVLVYLRDKYGRHFGRRSCEDIAEDLVESFNLHSCEVLEDGENGALVQA